MSSKHVKLNRPTNADLHRNPLIGASKGAAMAQVTPDELEEFAGANTFEGDIAARDCLLRYRRGNRVLAVASIFRDRENLMAELAIESAARSGAPTPVPASTRTFLLLRTTKEYFLNFGTSRT